MNDPHVEKLFYRIGFGDFVDYSKAAAASWPVLGGNFNVILHGKELIAEPLVHFASEDEARPELDPFLRRWEIEDAVSKGTVGIQFAFDRSSMIDRQPTPGVIEAKGLVTARPIIGVAKMVADQAAFPAPPTAPSCDIATERMFPRLKAIWDDDSYLTADGYYILTEVEDRFAPAPAGPPRPRTPSRKRVVAATRLNIDVDVLEKFGDLTSAAGERNARKASGAGRPFSEKEIRWVKAAAKAIVQRCLEYDANPSGPYPQITMASLPPL